MSDLPGPRRRRARSITPRRSPTDPLRPPATDDSQLDDRRLGDDRLDDIQASLELSRIVQDSRGASENTTAQLLSRLGRDIDTSPPQSPAPAKIDFSLLEYVSPVDSNLLCPICQCPFHRPMQLVCDHTFCNDCLKQCLDMQEGRTRICPACRGPVEALNYKSKITKAPRYVTQMLDDLVVKCPNSAHGCEREIKRGEVVDHVDKYCDYSIIECSDEECSQGIFRKLADQGCLHFLTMCQDCGESMMQKDLFDHEEKTCLKRFIRCQHCSEEMAKPHLKQHLASICLLVPSKCAGHPFGCPFEGSRTVVNEHVPSCTIASLAPYLSSQRSALEEQEKANKLLQRKVDILEGGFSSLQNMLNNTTSQATLPMEEPSLDTTFVGDAGALGIDVPSVQPPIQGLSSGTPPFDTPISHLLSLHESLRDELSRLESTIAELDSRTTVMILNESQRSKDEMTHANAAINSMRMQLHWLMSTRLQQTQRPAPRAGVGPAGEGSSSSASNNLSLSTADAESLRHEFGRQDTKL